MFDVFYCVILNTIVYRFVNGDQLNLVVSDGLSKWKDAFDSCNDPTYWHQIFNGCQPKSCNASSIADKIIHKPSYGSHQYWIYGYVLRSPVIVNIGCYSLTASVNNEFARGIFDLEDISALECYMACPADNVDYIFLRGRECLCIPKNTLDMHERNKTLLQENTGACNKSCAGNREDLCGDAAFVDGKVLYSVFQIVTRKRITANKVGNTCAELKFDTEKQYRFYYTSCNYNRMYICQRYNISDQSYKEQCPNENASWYAAQQKCQEQGMQLRSYPSPYFSTNCDQKEKIYWIGNHVAEKIIWANDALPKDASCLKLIVTTTGSIFEIQNCSNSLYSLCYKQQHTSSGVTDETYTTPLIQSYSSTDRTTLRRPVNAESDSEEDKTGDFIPIIAGCVGGFVVVVIVVIIVFTIQRSKKSNHKHLNTAVDQGEPDTYSEPTKNTVPEERKKLVVENTIQEENTKLVNVTEEGIYNHLGDSEKMIEMKPQDSSIYDVAGDDEYHVFTGNGKQEKFKDDDDLYDHGAASDVYNTLNDTVTPNRPESDTYNVINAK